MSRRKICWSEIPSELLSDIAGRLETRSDILHFRSVCNSWRNSAPFSLLDGKNTILSPILPHEFEITLLPHKFKFPPIYFEDRRISLVASSVFLLKSVANPKLQPWLFTVEEFNPGKLYLRKPLCRSVYNPLLKNFPHNLDLSRFRVSEVCKMYNLSFAPESDNVEHMKNRRSYKFSKVILYVDDGKRESNCNPRIDDCALIMLYDDGSDGALAKIKLENGVMSSLCSQNVKKFDDVVKFKGRICAVDRKGRVYWEANGVLGTSLAVYEPVGEGLGTDRKKRLVESCGELYLIYRCPRYAGVAFKVYKMNEARKKWDQLEGIGDDRILIATCDGCFFIQAKDVPSWRGNSLVFRRHVFPAYNSVYQADLEIFKTAEGNTLDIAVFHFGSGECRPIDSYPGYSTVFYPRSWLSSDTCCPKQGPKKVGDAQKDSCRKSCPELTSTKQDSCSLGIQKDTQAKNLSTEGVTTKMQCNKTIVADSAPIVTKSLESGVSKTKFQGVDVSLDLLPTLKKIWDKHGNILEGHPIRSNNLVSWALESIAKMEILLENTSDRSLNDSQADYLSSTLFDLQLVRLDVSWLAPSVEKALQLHKGVSIREKLEALQKETGSVKTLLADLRTELVAELGGLEQTVYEYRKTVLDL